MKLAAFGGRDILSHRATDVHTFNPLFSVMMVVVVVLD
jgi:hypothetical protein